MEPAGTLMDEDQLAGAGRKLEIISFVRKVADPLIHSTWSGVQEQQSEPYGLTTIYDLFVEDLELHQRSEGREEFLWLNSLEAEALSDLTRRLVSTVERVGYLDDNSVYLADPSWSEIVRSAQNCLKFLLDSPDRT